MHFVCLDQRRELNPDEADNGLWEARMSPNGQCPKRSWQPCIREVSALAFVREALGCQSCRRQENGGGALGPGQEESPRNLRSEQEL